MSHSGRQGSELDGITLLGNQGTKYEYGYNPDVLETFDNKHPDNDYFVKFNCPEFTSLCHCNLNEFKRKCYGDIEIVITDTTYEIRTETDNTSLLNHIACHG